MNIWSYLAGDLEDTKISGIALISFLVSLGEFHADGMVDNMSKIAFSEEWVVMQWIEAHLAVLRHCKAMDLALIERIQTGGVLAHPSQQEEQLEALVEAEEKAKVAALVQCCTLLDCSQNAFQVSEEH